MIPSVFPRSTHHMLDNDLMSFSRLDSQCQQVKGDEHVFYH